MSRDDAELAGLLYSLHWACEEVAAYLPVDRVSLKRLTELAAMLAAAHDGVLGRAERMVADAKEPPAP